MAFLKTTIDSERGVTVEEVADDYSGPLLTVSGSVSSEGGTGGNSNIYTVLSVGGGGQQPESNTDVMLIAPELEETIVNLPSDAATGFFFTIKKIVLSIYGINLMPPDGVAVEGSASLYLLPRSDDDTILPSYGILFDGTSWWVL